MSEPLDCKDLVEIVTAYFDDAMTTAERERFEHHLEECEDCVNYVAQMRMTVELTGTLSPDDIQPETLDALLSAFRDYNPPTSGSPSA